MARYEKPILTVDVVYFTVIDDKLNLLLVRRENEPFKDNLALPGGYVHCDEDSSMNDTAHRIIKSKSKIAPVYLEQVETIAGDSRDPRGWSATVLFMAIVNELELTEKPDDNIKWVPVKELPDIELAFDHNKLISIAHERFTSKSRYTSLPLYLLPELFTLTQAQKCFEISADSALEKKSFRRRLLDAGIVEDTGEVSTTGRRKAALYRSKPEHVLHYFPRTIG